MSSLSLLINCFLAEFLLKYVCVRKYGSQFVVVVINEVKQSRQMETRLRKILQKQQNQPDPRQTEERAQIHIQTKHSVQISDIRRWRFDSLVLL